jgi:hypothetical protein
MARNKLQMDEDPVEVGVAIKRGFEKTIASHDKPPPVDAGYLLGVAVWWLVIFAGLSIAGVSWLPAAILAAILCGFWPVFLLFDR